MKTQTNIKSYCFIARQYPPETGFGGIGTYVWHMARALTSNGIDVTIFSYSTEKDKIYVEDGIRVVRRKAKSLISWYIKVTFFLIRNKFDVIEDAEFLGSTFLYLMFFNRRSNFIHIKLHTCHKIVHYYEKRKSLFQKFTTYIINLIEAYVTRKANLISAPTNFIKQVTGLLWNIPENRIKILPLPFYISINDEELKSIPESYILYFGRLQERKHAELILYLCKRNFLNNKPFNLILIGEDKWGFKNKLAMVDNDTSKKIEILDHIADKKILFAYIKFAKAVFLPSKFESFSFATLESLWFNKKTFVLNNSGPLEIMMSLGLDENILDERLLLCDSNYLISKISKPINLNIKEIRERITNIYGYNVIFNDFMKIMESKILE
jgi:glycosyltransferase involved in cell wall biosynthesis